MIGHLQYLIGGASGLLMGLALMLVFKKDFWRLASTFYRKFSRENEMLKVEVDKWKSMCQDEQWFKDLEKYNTKLEAVQRKATMIATKELQIQIDTEELEEKYKNYSAQLDEKLIQLGLKNDSKDNN